MLDDDVGAFKLGVELVRLVFSRVKAKEDEFTGAVDILVGLCDVAMALAD